MIGSEPSGDRGSSFGRPRTMPQYGGLVAGALYGMFGADSDPGKMFEAEPCNEWSMKVVDP